MGLLILWEHITERLVRVEEDGLTISLMTPWGEMSQKHIPTDQITSIKVGQSSAQGHNNMTVQVWTDQERVSLGAGLPEEVLHWLKDCLVAAIFRM